ncbi:glycoside hydrolase family 32 protein [Luteolibacter sp. SL250]|uniref:glycoside hydrolase family 32 protein n=1 Tax=Luteolibacter sp. SL250 TaxID=2995170 RepID=UPI00226E0EB5|nr:glycoside hydrolase family 32 protein [Luteolibacter sp. SL250]WAC18999.1 glycoside hydrolase family 32 protein [Luteolibacter sp. SL250]
MKSPSLPFSFLLLASTVLHAADDISLADFEGDSYAPWVVEGKAFGGAPARGTLPGQMKVEGYVGGGLANSFAGGDRAKGRLVSPEFQVSRKYVRFLIGGGGWKEQTVMHLRVDGKTVRSATGRNIRSGGSEKLSAAWWDVEEFAGRRAVIEIIDDREGTWGHINVDQIVLTDDKGDASPAIHGVEMPGGITRRVKVDGDFLQLPVMRNPDRERPDFQRLELSAGGRVVRYLHVVMPAAGRQPDFWYSLDVRAFKGREVELRYASADSGVLDRLAFGDREIIDPAAYDGPHRPRFHFSPRIGWMNDINGIYYQDGLYHLFYQYNPVATAYGAGFDMHWGHSVSRDLLRWEEWPVVLFPEATGKAYSGTTVMQHQPIPGVNDGVKLPAPAMFFTATDPNSQHLATTRDGGRTWQRHPGNPVVPPLGDGDRDPKVVWHEASQHYVMVLYVGEGGDTYRFLRSKDLTKWETTSVIPGWYECPEFFPVKSPTTGEELMLLYGCYRGTPPGAEKPVRYESCYQLGRFDGKTFTPVTEIRPAHLGPAFYGALVFMNEPQGRTVMMGWARGTRFPDEPFNQCATVPLEMKLRAIDGRDTLCYEPVAEIAALRGTPLLAEKNLTTAQANEKLAGVPKDASLDVVVRFRQSPAASVGVKVRGVHFQYDAAAKEISLNGKSTAVHPSGTLDARILIDRGIIEAFWNGGEAAHATGSLHTDDGPALAFGGEAEIEEITVHPMKDIRKGKE